MSKLHDDAARYDLLHEIGTRPRTAYLARVRNPNPELPRTRVRWPPRIKLPPPRDPLEPRPLIEGAHDRPHHQ